MTAAVRMDEEAHCATCRCAKTITGRIAKMMDAAGEVVWTPVAVADAVGFGGSDSALRTTLNRMAKEGKIYRLRPGHYLSCAYKP